MIVLLQEYRSRKVGDVPRTCRMGRVSEETILLFREAEIQDTPSYLGVTHFVLDLRLWEDDG